MCHNLFDQLDILILYCGFMWPIVDSLAISPFLQMLLAMAMVFVYVRWFAKTLLLDIDLIHFS